MYSPPARPPSQPNPAKIIGAGCLGCFGLLVLLATCGALFSAVDPQPSPTTTRTAQAAATSPSPTPSLDQAARTMCAGVVQAEALRRAGWGSKADDALDEAVSVALQSQHPAVVKLAAEPIDEFGDLAEEWCGENLPEVTASPVPSRTPKPRKTTRRPDPEPEEPSLRTVTPGAYCSPTGAKGIANGRIYTCKGPGQSRWRQ